MVGQIRARLGGSATEANASFEYRGNRGERRLPAVRGGAILAMAVDFLTRGAGEAQRTADAVQVFGGSGYIRGFEAERLCRDARICRIYPDLRGRQPDPAHDHRPRTAVEGSRAVSRGVAPVTGSGRGIGLAAAVAPAHEGCAVAVDGASRSEAPEGELP